MTHSDDKGLILPPKIAPIQVVIIPIYKGEDELNNISEVALNIKKEIELKGVSVKYDDRNNFKPGFKFNEHELKGVPIRIVVGARDLKNNIVEIKNYQFILLLKIILNLFVQTQEKLGL